MIIMIRYYRRPQEAEGHVVQLRMGPLDQNDNDNNNKKKKKNNNNDNNNNNNNNDNNKCMYT